MPQTIILLSVRPRYMRKILGGIKTVELRRIRPRIRSGDILLFYESSPSKELVAIAHIVDVFSDNPEVLWDSVADEVSISKDEFQKYFAGADEGVAIRFGMQVTFDPGIPLRRLRAVWPGFQPPQTHRYMTPVQLEQLQLSHRIMPKR